MHRTFSLPRLVGWWVPLITLMLHVGLDSASAQPPLLPSPVAQGQPDIKQQEIPTVMMVVGTTQTYQMATSKEPLKQVENPNNRVLEVRRVPGSLTQIFFDAKVPGNTRVKLVDQKDKIEYVDVVVISDRVKEMRDLIQRSIPTGSVNVASTDNGALVLTGTVMSAEDSRTLQQLVQAVGGTVINNVRVGGVQTVQIEVVVAIVNRSEARQMSFTWNVNGPNWFAASTIGGAGGLSTVLNPLTPPQTTSSITSTGSNNIAFGILNNPNSFLGYLQALRTEGLTKILAEPRVTTLSGRPGFIISGGETPIVTGGGGGQPASVTYKQFGTVVNFLPIVLGNGKIHLEVRPELSAIDPAAGVTLAGGTSAPGFKTRSCQVAVQIEDGQTLAIGGLIQNTIAGSISRVPVLGDLPYLGVLFSQKTFTETEEEMIILVTPRLVDPVDCCKIPKYLPGRETRAPDDYELFLEGILEAPRGPRSVVFHPHLYQAAYKNSPNAGQYPCADGSCNNRSGAGCANGNCAVGAAGLPRTSGLANGPMPAPSFPDSPVMPAANYRVAPEPQGVPATLPMLPQMRDLPPTLGPATPTIPSTPPLSRAFENRPALPPVNSPYGN